MKINDNMSSTNPVDHLDISQYNVNSQDWDSIVDYAIKCGILNDNNCATETDLMVDIGEGDSKKRYVCNVIKNTICRQDEFGVNYLSKNEEETQREKLYLLHELKKLYLKKTADIFAKDLDNGVFNVDTVGRESIIARIKCLEEKQRGISQIIGILEEQDYNFGRNFGQQISSCVESLKKLWCISRIISDAEWNDQIDKLIQPYLTTVSDNCSELMDGQRKLLIRLFDTIRSTTFVIESLDKFSSFDEISELQKDSDFLGAFVRNVKLAALVMRKSQIEKELKKTKLLEAQIREKEREIKSIRQGFSKAYELSDDNEKRYERLVKGQRSHNARLHKDGLKRAKELSENNEFKAKLRHCTYNIDKEQKDVLTTLRTINNELSTIARKDVNIDNKILALKMLQEDRIPALEEELDLINSLTKKLESRTAIIGNQIRSGSLSERETENQISYVYTENVGSVHTLERQYEKLSMLLNEIESIKREIETYAIKKSEVRPEKINIFKQTIFKEAGGQQRGDYAYVNHESCQPPIPFGTKRGKCLYKSATDDTVDFAVKEAERGVNTLNEDDFRREMSSYTHSYNLGGGKTHRYELDRVARFVLTKYSEVEKNISDKENEIQLQITNNERALSAKQAERDVIREKIVEKENELNNRNLERYSLEMKKDKLCSEKVYYENLEEVISAYLIKVKDFESFITDDKLSHHEDNVSELKDKVKELITDMGEKESKILSGGEFIALLAQSDARIILSQYSQYLTSMGNLQKQENEKMRISEQMASIGEKLDSNHIKKADCELKLEETVIELSDKKELIEKLIMDQVIMVFDRSEYEKDSLIGLSNTIKEYRKQIEILDMQEKTEIAKLNQTKGEIIRRKVYRALPENYKGTTYDKDSNYPDIGTVVQLYKNRKQNMCQDIFESKQCQPCDYFDSVEIIIKNLLLECNMPVEKIYEELINKQRIFEKHGQLQHKNALDTAIGIVKNNIVDFASNLCRITLDYTNKRKSISDEIQKNAKNLVQKKLLDGIVIVQREGSRSAELDKDIVRAHLESGVDMVVVEDREIFTQYHSRLSSLSFMKQLISHRSLPDGFTEEGLHVELKKLLNTRNPVLMEDVLLQNKETHEKLLYKLLLHYFRKTYLKEKVKLFVEINLVTTLETEIKRIRRDIAEISREDKQLQRQICTLDRLWHFNLKEIERLHERNQDGVLPKTSKEVDIEDLDAMRATCTELLSLTTSENNTNKNMIASHKADIERCRSKCEDEILDETACSNIKLKILSNRFKIGLHITNNHHRNCNADCNYFQKVDQIIDEVVRMCCAGVSVQGSYCNVIEQLAVNDHSREHLNGLKQIKTYVKEEYQLEREKRVKVTRREIRELEWEKACWEAQIEASDKIIMTQLIETKNDVLNYITFRREAIFLDDNSEYVLESSEQELVDYKQDTFKFLFNNQVTCLISCLTTVLDQVKRHKTRTIEKCIFEIFKEFYIDLSDNNVIVQIISKLKQELKNEDFEPSILKSIIRQKSGKMGGLEYILNKISHAYRKKNYNANVDPEQIHCEMLKKEKQIKIAQEEISVESLQKDLTELKARKNDLGIQDTSLLSEEFKNVVSCIQHIEDAKQVASLRNRFEELENCWRNRDDYFSFDLENRRTCVRLLNTDTILKSEEIKNIDKIRILITTHASKLLEQKVLIEQCVSELNKENDNLYKTTFFEIQRQLLVKGMLLCGYSSYGNGEPLNERNGFIAAILGALVGEHALYQIGGLNDTNKRVESLTRRIGSRCNEFTHGEHIVNLDDINISDFIDTVNDEFESDNLFINQINVIGKQRKLKQFFPKRHGVDGLCVTVLWHESKTFLLVKRETINITGNVQTDMGVQITYIMTALKTEEDLFIHLCGHRLRNVLKILLSDSKKLAETYKLEVGNLARINSLTDFNSLFCNALKITDVTDFSSISLFAYLSYLEDLESCSIHREDLLEKAERCQMIKDMYKKALFTIINEEQQKRKKKNDSLQCESKEEVYLEEEIDQGENDLNERLQEIYKLDVEIQKNIQLENAILFEKQDARNKYKEKLDELSKNSSNLKERIKSAQEKIRELKKSSEENEEAIREGQVEIQRLESELAEIEKQITRKEEDQQALEIELMKLNERERNLNGDLQIVSEAKAKREKEQIEKTEEIEVSNDMLKFMQNFKLILANAKLQSKMEDVREAIFNSSNLNSIFDKLEVILKQIAVEDGNLWEKLIEGIDIPRLQRFVRSGKKIVKETQHDLITRLRGIGNGAMKVDCELVQEVTKDKLIRKFKMVATNVTSQDVSSKAKIYVERELSSNDSTSGLYFDEHHLCSTEYGVKSIKELPTKLRGLIERRIELRYESEKVDSMKSETYKKAANIINELKINYEDAIQCYVDEIEIVASGTFILNDSLLLPGIDLTISAVNMECVGDNLTVDTSGQDGIAFKHKNASHGKVKRKNNKPKGDAGFAGFDGSHGHHGGNIVIKIENEVKNLDALEFLKANGGDGKQGQLGGDGDEGFKGTDGANGVADDTRALGSGQTTIGFGSPGSVGGTGGSCGDTGRWGLGGKAGVIDFVHFNKGEMNPGKDAKNILETQKPQGGDGGEPGFFGMDQIKDKVNFWHKTKTFYTVVDRAHLIEHNPELRKRIEEARNINNTNQDVLLGAILLPVNPLGLIIVSFSSKRLTWREVDNQNEYRNSNRNNRNLRGEKNEVEAKLREDERVPQDVKREAVNIENLHSKLNDKKTSDAELSGESLYSENITDLAEQKEELVAEIDRYAQEVANLTCEMENVALARATKCLEIDTIREQIASLKRTEKSIDSDRVSRVSKVLRAIDKSQNLRDKEEGLSVKLSHLIASLGNYHSLREQLQHGRDDHVRILDEYLAAVRGRLERLRHDSKQLKSDFANRKAEVTNLKKRSEDLRTKRLGEIETEIEIDEEIEEEFEIRCVEEITNVIDMENENLYTNQQPISKSCPALESFYSEDVEIDLEKLPNDISGIQFILGQCVKNFRSGTYDESQIKILVETINKNCVGMADSTRDIKKLLATMETDIVNIKMKNNLEKLNSIDRHILLDYFQSIVSRLEVDSLASFYDDDENVENFLLNLLKKIEINDVSCEQSLLHKLQLRKKGHHLVNNDKLKNDLKKIVSLIEDRKVFYLESCAINLTHECAQQWKNKIRDYHNEQTINNLVTVVRSFKEHQKVLGAEKCTNVFFETVLENMRWHGKVAVEQNIDTKNIVNFMKIINEDISLLSGVTKKQKALMNQICNIVSEFCHAVAEVKESAKTKKLGNEAVKSLKMVTVKLITYVEVSSNNKNVVAVNNIVESYLALFGQNQSVTGENVDSMSERLERCNGEIIEKNI